MKYFHLLFLILLFSCNNAKKIQQSKSEFIAYNKKMYSFYSFKANANFGFQFSKPINNSPDTSGPLIFQGGYFDEKGQSLKGGELILGEKFKINNIKNQNGRDTIIDKKIIGTTQLFSFHFPDKDSSFTNRLITENSFYIPKLLRFTSKMPDYDQEKNIITAGDTFTWEPDINNDRKEIVIGVEYKANGLFNEKYKLANPKDVSHAIIIEDNGIYTFTDNLFQNIPKDATVSITFSRRNYKEFNIKNKKHVLYASYFYYADYKLK